MEKINVKIVALLVASALLALGCPAPSSGPYTISGTVRDSVTGAPVQGATVVVGTDSVVTDGTGAFSFAYSSGAPLTTDVLVYKGTDYQFWGTTNVTIDVATNPTYAFYLIPNDSSSYPAITITGDLPVTAGTGAVLQMIVENAAGGIWEYLAYPPQFATSYALTCSTYGADCLVSIVYDDNDLAQPIIQYYQHVNLAGSATLDITTLATTAVTVNGSIGDLFIASLDYSPCDIPNYVPQDVLTAPSKAVNVYNGDSLPLAWTTGAVNANTPVANYQTIKYNFGPSVAFSTNVTLPASASTIPSPSGVVNMAGVSWTAGARTIAFTPVSDATLHVVQLTDNSGRQGRFLADAPSGTVVLPADFVTSVLGAGAGWDSQIMPIGSNRSLSSFIDMRIGGSGPTNITDLQIAMVMSNTGLDVRADLIP